MRHRALLSTLLTSLGFSACAGPHHPSLAELSNQVQLESLPAESQIQVNGRPMGQAPLTLPLEEGQSYEIHFTAPGFNPYSVRALAEKLHYLGEVVAVLVPTGLSQPSPAYDDTAGLTAIAEELERRKDWGHSAEFWRRVIVLQPRFARAHRGMGSCLAKLGQDEQAIREYTQYLFLAPDAPDAARVQRAIDHFRGGIDLPGG